jgi:hypothetical protein
MVVIHKVDIMFHIIVEIILSQNCSFRMETKHTHESLYRFFIHVRLLLSELRKNRILKTELTDEYFMKQRNLNVVNVHKCSFVESVNTVH